MNRERVVFFLDYANINRAASDLGLTLDYGALLEYMGEGRFLVESHVYVPIDPRNEHRLDSTIEQLWADGYVVHRKVGTIAQDSYKCDFDVEITIDVLGAAYQVRPDIIVLGTGDGDFVPLVHEVRRLGVRAEVASFDAAASRELKLKSSGFISLDVYIGEALEDQDHLSGTAPEAADVPADQEVVVDRVPGAGVANQAHGSARPPQLPKAQDY